MELGGVGSFSLNSNALSAQVFNCMNIHTYMHIFVDASMDGLDTSLLFNIKIYLHPHLCQELVISLDEFAHVLLAEEQFIAALPVIVLMVGEINGFSPANDCYH